MSQKPPQRTLLVNELYPSLQGESTYAGRACVFIRLTGCPLRCKWCDSEYAFSGGERFTLEEILNRVAAYSLPLVEVTGGEPLAQPNCLPLLKALCDAGYQVLLETSGALELSGVDPRVIKIVDIKCPASGEAEKNDWTNLQCLGPRDEVKFVIANRIDYDYAKMVLSDHSTSLSRRPIHFSPVMLGSESPIASDLAAWILADRLQVHLQLQLHKFLWPAKTQGV